MRVVIALFRIFLFGLSALVTFIIQRTLLLFTKGPIVLWYPRYYHAFLCWVFGIKVIVEGEPLKAHNVVYAGNHISYLDIEVVGSLINGCFIAKEDIESWPILGAMGKLQRTIFISRNPKNAPIEIKQMEDRLKEGLPLIIFPEGTSSIGKEVLPFKSSAFEIFLKQNIYIQPFTVSLMSVDEKTQLTDADRDLYAWYGDMDFEPHFWLFSKLKGATIKVSFQKPITTNCYKNRKELCTDVYNAVREGLDLSTTAT